MSRIKYPILDIEKNINELDTDYKKIANLGNYLFTVFNMVDEKKYGYEYDIDEKKSKKLPIKKFFDIIEKEYVKIYKRAKRRTYREEYEKKYKKEEDMSTEKYEKLYIRHAKMNSELAAIALWGSFVTKCLNGEKPIKYDVFEILYVSMFDSLYPGVDIKCFYYEILAFWAAMVGDVDTTRWYTKKALELHRKRKSNTFKKIHKKFLESFSKTQSVFKVTPTSLLYENGRELNKTEESIMSTYRKIENKYKKDIKNKLLDNYFVPVIVVDENRII